MKEPGKILVVTLSNIGDAVLTLPVIGALRERYKDALIDVVVGPRAAEIFDSDPRINKAYVYDKSASLLAKVSLILDIRKAGYDLAIDLRNSILGLLSGAKVCSRPAKTVIAGGASINPRSISTGSGNWAYRLNTNRSRYG
jgi:hypothetical protein